MSIPAIVAFCLLRKNGKRGIKAIRMQTIPNEMASEPNSGSARPKRVDRSGAYLVTTAVRPITAKVTLVAMRQSLAINDNDDGFLAIAVVWKDEDRNCTSSIKVFSGVRRRGFHQADCSVSVLANSPQNT